MGILRDLAKKAAFTLYYPAAKWRLPRLFDKQHREGNLQYLSDEDFKVWKAAYLDMLRENYRTNFAYGQRAQIQDFALANIQVVRKSAPCEAGNPIVVLCVKDDLARLQMLVDHYRAAGIRKFAFLDNGSTDGTYEWMLGQSDVDVFRTEDRYTSIAKEAWINRLVAHYGFNRWYILTDSDELVTYTGIERHPISELVAKAEKMGRLRMPALTLDLYAREGVFLQVEREDIQKKYRWMDRDSYEQITRRIGGTLVRWFVGGPRKRGGIAASLSKYPLVYAAPGTISANAHYQYPYRLMDDVPYNLAILHYKFIGNDQKTYAQRAQKGSGFAYGGSFYRKYLQIVQDKRGSFMYEGSIQYEDSQSLRAIESIEPINFEDDGDTDRRKGERP